MNEHQEPLKQRTPLLPTGVPNGLDEAPCSIRYGRQTGQVQQRVGHEDQTPMFSDGFGAPHTILVEAQVPLTVLIKRFRRPALRIQADDLRGVPVHAVGHKHAMPSGQRLALKTDHDPDLAQGGDTDPQCEAPIGVLAYGDGAISIGRDQRQERLDRHVRAWQLQRPAMSIPQVKTGRFQPTVRFEQADPVLTPSDQDLDQVLRQVPRVKHHYPKGHLAPDGLFDQLDRQGNFGLKLLVPRPTLGILEQHRVDLLMQAVPRFSLGRDFQLWKMLGHRGFPLGQLLIAPIQAQAHGEAHRATDIEAGDRVMRQGVSAVAMVVVAVDIVEEAAHMFAQGIIDGQERFTAAPAMGLGLLQHEAEATSIDGVLTPRSLGEKAGEVGFVGALQEAAGDIGHALIREDDQAGQIVLEMAKLALVLKQVAEDRRVLGDHRSRLNNGKFHRTPPYPGQGIQAGPKVAWRSRYGKSQQPSTVKKVFINSYMTYICLSLKTSGLIDARSKDIGVHRINYALKEAYTELKRGPFEAGLFRIKLLQLQSKTEGTTN